MPHSLMTFRFHPSGTVFRLPSFGGTHIRFAVWLLLAAFAVQPAAADSLITLEGQLIETRGPWTIDGEILTYTGADGVLQSLPVADVDLEASEETTALNAGRTWEPAQRSRPEPFELTSPTAEARAGDEPKVILYMTSWCGYCRKARKLLRELDADFVAKDIEKNRKAAAEFRRKNGGRGGVPLIDIDGELVRGYDAKRIRKLVAELEEE